jgi:hypothetical protein
MLQHLQFVEHQRQSSMQNRRVVSASMHILAPLRLAQNWMNIQKNKKKSCCIFSTLGSITWNRKGLGRSFGIQQELVLIVVLPCILISSKLVCQQMHSLLKHKMLQLTLKISLCMAPTCFSPFGPSPGSIRRNLAKVTVFVEIISKNTSLKWLLCSGNMCFSL